MSAITLIRSALREGVWHGEFLFDGGDAPQLEALHQDRAVAGLEQECTGDGHLRVRLPLPVERIGDGVQTFVIVRRGGGDKVASFTLIAGEVADSDLRGELELLRAELDMLKRAFRRHCIETMG